MFDEVSRDELGKVFVGGLPDTATTESMRKHFEKIGPLRDCTVMFDKESGRQRGFGFITFVNPHHASLCLSKPQIVDDKEVDCKRAVPRDFHRPGSRVSIVGTLFKTTKVFVGGIPHNVNDGQLKEYFTKYGTVKEARVLFDRINGRSRGFGFVQFEKEESVDEVVKCYDDHKIENKWIEVKRALPRNLHPNFDSGGNPGGPPHRRASTSAGFYMRDGGQGFLDAPVGGGPNGYFGNEGWPGKRGMHRVMAEREKGRSRSPGRHSFGMSREKAHRVGGSVHNAFYNEYDGYHIGHEAEYDGMHGFHQGHDVGYPGEVYDDYGDVYWFDDSMYGGAPFLEGVGRTPADHFGIPYVGHGRGSHGDDYAVSDRLNAAPSDYGSRDGHRLGILGERPPYTAAQGPMRMVGKDVKREMLPLGGGGMARGSAVGNVGRMNPAGFRRDGGGGAGSGLVGVSGPSLNSSQGSHQRLDNRRGGGMSGNRLGLHEVIDVTGDTPTTTRVMGGGSMRHMANGNSMNVRLPGSAGHRRGGGGLLQPSGLDSTSGYLGAAGTHFGSYGYYEMAGNNSSCMLPGGMVGKVRPKVPSALWHSNSRRYSYMY